MNSLTATFDKSDIRVSIPINCSLQYIHLQTFIIIFHKHTHTPTHTLTDKLTKRENKRPRFYERKNIIVIFAQPSFFGR